MKKILLLISLLGIASFCFSQQKYQVGYNELKTYEGLYQYFNHSTIRIAASPTQNILYAFVNQTPYALKPYAKDKFKNAVNDSLIFFRDQSNAVIGYVVDNNTFKIINRKVSFPKEKWYPRLAAYKGFIAPAKLNDGLKTGSLNESGLDTALLNQMMQKIVSGVYPNVHSVVIIKDGKLVFEEYFYEYNRDSLQEMRSASKSIVSALTGIAIDKGFIKSKNEKVLPYFPEYDIKNNSDAKKRITIENMLTNQSGFDYDEANVNSLGTETKMGASADWVKYTLDLPLIDTPGGKGMYCSGNPVTIGRIIEKTTKTDLPVFANQNLFGPLQITKYKWIFKPDKSREDDFCQVYLTPRSMAKFGLMYLNKGVWNGKQVVSANWVDESLAPHSVVQGVNYGYLWWLKYLDADGVRYEAAGAQGNGGQKIYIWKSLNMVTVITGGNFNSQSPSDELLKKYILPAFNRSKK